MIQLTTMTAKNFLKTRICWIYLWSEECIKCRRNHVENKSTKDTMRLMSPNERTRVQTLILCAEWRICASTHTVHSQRVRVLKPASISQNTWSRCQINPPVDYLPRLWSQAFFQMPTKHSRCIRHRTAWFLRRWERGALP